MSDPQNPGGWPDAARPGVPQNSERDGWHWLHHPEDLRPFPIPWDADHAAWCSGSMHSPQCVVDLGYRYLGPCLTPAEVAAREAAACIVVNGDTIPADSEEAQCVIEAAAERARSLFAEDSIGHDTVPAAIRALLEGERLRADIAEHEVHFCELDDYGEDFWGDNGDDEP